MQQDDMPIAVLHAFDDSLKDGLGLHAGLPVLGIDRLTHIHEVLFFGLHKRHDLIVTRWVAVGIVGRTE